MRILQLLTLNALCNRALRLSDPFVRLRHFAGFVFRHSLTAPNLRYVIENLPAAGCRELMCHPGLDDPRIPYGHWGYRWAADLDALVDPRGGNLLRQSGIPLISYRNLSQEYARATQEGPIHV